MGANRVFVPQEALDRWLTEGRVVVDGELMTLQPEGKQFKLQTAVHFISEVTDGSDPHALINRVKDVEQLAKIGGEHVADSVIVGDHAYQVVEGFAGEPLTPGDSVATGSSLDAAALAAVGESQPGDVDLLAKFFLGSR